MWYDQAQLPPARNASARDSTWPVGTLLGGENPPAALFQELERISPSSSFLLVEFLSPRSGLVHVAPDLKKLHQPLQGFGDARLVGRGDLSLALLQALIALQQ